MLRIGVLSLLLLAGAAMAAPRVTAVALYDGKAMLEIDGQRRLLRQGESSPEGVRLVTATSSGVIIEMEGRRHALALSRRVGGSYARPEATQVRIPQSGNGMYQSAGTINGAPVRFLVDTGASMVAMNSADAARAGVDYRRGTRVQVSTAKGPALAYQVMVDRVAVAGLSVSYVQALVLEGPYPETPLLGMSYLGRVKLRHEGALMVLEQVE